MKVREYISSAIDNIQALPVELIEEVITILQEARFNGKQIFILGNGGSASTASHFVCDLAKNTKGDGWPHYRVIGLTDNIASLTANSNDDGYENAFSLQLENLINEGDIVIGISASGNSPNVLNAMELAEEFKATKIGFTGFEGGILGQMVDVHIHIPNNNYGQVEDIHLMLEHIIVNAIQDEMKSRNPSLESLGNLPVLVGQTG